MYRKNKILLYIGSSATPLANARGSEARGSEARGSEARGSENFGSF